MKLLDFYNKAKEKIKGKPKPGPDKAKIMAGFNNNAEIFIEMGVPVATISGWRTALERGWEKSYNHAHSDQENGELFFADCMEDWVDETPAGQKWEKAHPHWDEYYG